MFDKYFEVIAATLDRVRRSNAEGIKAAARLVADTVAADGIVHAFGSGHSALLALELTDRAGGLASVEAIVDPTNGRAETLEGYAAMLVRDYDLRPPDCLVVASTSGRNALPIEMALIGRERGLHVIAITSVAFSRAFASRHSSGLRLCDVADVVLDTDGAVGDAALCIDGLSTPVGPTSTVIGAALINAVFVEAIAELTRRGVPAPIYLSQNIDGADEHNEALATRYRGRIRAI